MSKSSHNIRTNTLNDDSDLFEDPFDNIEDLEKFKNQINHDFSKKITRQITEPNESAIIIEPGSDESLRTKNQKSFYEKKKPINRYLRRKTTMEQKKIKNINIEEFCNRNLNLREFKGFSNLRKSNIKNKDNHYAENDLNNSFKMKLKTFYISDQENQELNGFKESKEITPINEQELKESGNITPFKNNSDLNEDNLNCNNEKLGIEIIEEKPLNEIKQKIKAYKKKKTILRNLKEFSKITIVIPKRFKMYKNLTKQDSLGKKFYGKAIDIITGKSKNLLNNLLIVQISKCGKSIAMSLYKNVLIILNIKVNPPLKLIDLKNFLVLENNRSDQITHIEWSSNSQYIATAMLDHKLFIWNISKKSILMEVSHDEMITAIAFFGDQKVIVSALKNGHLRFWDIEKGTTLFWHHLEAYITAIRFSPNAKYLISGYMDGTIKIHKYFQKFTNVFSCNLNKLNYISSKTKTNEKPKERKKGFIDIFKSKKLKNFKIYDFIFTCEKKFLILSQGCRIRLFNIETQFVEQKYKINNGFSQIPQSIDYFNGYVLMSAFNGKIYLWNEKNNYVPPFNPNFFFHNPLINFSFEELTVVDKFPRMPKNFFACFLNQDIVNEWNSKSNREAEFIFFSITNTGQMSFCIKEKCT